MTPKQSECLRAVNDLTMQDGETPTVRRLAGHLGTSLNNAFRLLGNLERDGYVIKSKTGRILCGPYERAMLEGRSSEDLGKLRDLCLSILAKRIQ